jgi:hypothetical protein
LRLPVSFNLAARRLWRAGLLAPLRSALAASGADARLLELELTEAALPHDPRGALPLFAQLKAMGLRIAIDDFGSGHSSLAGLRRLPIDTLKIDRSFVHDLESNADHAAIVAAIIAISKSLKLQVVAVNVQTRGQMARLFEQGCQLMQGDLFAPALPAAELARLPSCSGRTHDWRVCIGDAATAAPPTLPPGGAHSNGRHFGRLSGMAAPPPPAPAWPDPAAPVPPQPVPAVAAAPGAQHPLDDASAEPASAEPHAARACRWASRFPGRQ